MLTQKMLQQYLNIFIYYLHSAEPTSSLCYAETCHALQSAMSIGLIFAGTAAVPAYFRNTAIVSLSFCKSIMMIVWFDVNGIFCWTLRRMDMPTLSVKQLYQSGLQLKWHCGCKIKVFQVMSSYSPLITPLMAEHCCTSVKLIFDVLRCRWPSSATSNVWRYVSRSFKYSIFYLLFDIVLQSDESNYNSMCTFV